MGHSEMTDIHNIIMSTLKIVPKAWDMHRQKFNCDCHFELTDETYKLVGERFNTTPEGGEKIVDRYFILTGGQV